jgi:hypothetical protein
MQGFIEKTKTERETLRFINSHFGSPDLAGLTLPAINTWAAADINRKAIVGDLVEVSAVLASLWERSGGRFDTEHEGINAKARSLIEKLRSRVIEER